MILLIFGSIFKGHLSPDVTFTQYFVTGMIASGLMATGFQALAHPDPDRARPGRAQALPRHTDAALGLLRRQDHDGATRWRIAETALLLAFAVAFDHVSLPSTGLKWFTLAWVRLLGITACTLCGIAFSSRRRVPVAAPRPWSPRSP